MTYDARALKIEFRGLSPSRRCVDDDPSCDLRNNLGGCLHDKEQDIETTGWLSGISR